jgi:hypothetical protein
MTGYPAIARALFWLTLPFAAIAAWCALERLNRTARTAYTCLTLALLGVGIYLLTTRLKQSVHVYDLSPPTRRNKFSELLKGNWTVDPNGQRQPVLTLHRDTVQVGCAVDDPGSCVSAGEFLLLLSEAGWQIERPYQVNRLIQNIPREGVAIVSHPTVQLPPNLPPHLGVYQKTMPSALSLSLAFADMGIPVYTGRDDNLPNGIVGVYFGREPEHATGEPIPVMVHPLPAGASGRE